MRRCAECDKEKPEEEFAGPKRKRCYSCSLRYFSEGRPPDFMRKHPGDRRRSGERQAEWKRRLAQLVEQQDGLCAICRLPGRSLKLDHCHQTGKVRGALCQQCNSGMGYFRDEIQLLRRAIDYLEAWGTLTGMPPRETTLPVDER